MPGNASPSEEEQQEEPPSCCGLCFTPIEKGEAYRKSSGASAKEVRAIPCLKSAVMCPVPWGHMTFCYFLGPIRGAHRDA